MSSEMPDSTKELLDAHHASILRELTGVSTAISDLRRDVRVVSENVRDRLDEHATEDNQRFSAIDNNLSVLKWAYGVGLVVLAAIFALLKVGVL